ncbi:MAG: GNAT family N-acetyltransferase [Clostridia bacterium]|nr:GNAT family N-acetyltransferase [Clostridia bacterium]
MSNLTFTIRPAAADDLDKLWPMVRRAVQKMNAGGSEQWGDDYPTREFYAGDIERRELWVAASPEGQIYGVALMTDAPEAAYRDISWAVPSPVLVIHRMAVDPDLQRSGVGAALFRHAESLALKQGLGAIHIDTYGKNAAMQGLIVSQGFTKMGEIRLHGRPLAFPCFEKRLRT